jgi:FkbM family methyltransferase
MKLSGLLKPEYFYQPRLALRRLSLLQPPLTAEFVDEQLPWGMPIRVRPLEEHGRILLTLRVIDLAVTETLWRLADPGELAVDVGANIGYMTAVLAARIDSIPGGSVQAFEAHPEIFQELKYNAERWQRQLMNTKFDIQQIAISDQRGKVALGIPDSFSTNRGLAAVLTPDNPSNQPDSTPLKTVMVESVFLDELFPAPERIGVLKLDVEGHELHVLKGANRLLQEQRVRDCIFEEHGNYPTDVTAFFEERGYSIFRIQRQFFGPTLLAPDSYTPRSQWQPTSFLATQQPERSTSRFKKRGWQVLKGKQINISKAVTQDSKC